VVAYTPGMHKVELFWQQLARSENRGQLQRYTARQAPDYIKKFIMLGGGARMGTTMEQYARFHFSVLQKRAKGKEETGYDHLLSGQPQTFVEQKSAGHWTDTGYKWQHIEPNHKWTLLLLCGIDYEEVKFWGLNRATFQRLVEEKKITNQGAKGGQSSEGMWFNYGDVQDALVPLVTDADLVAFASTC
jgi:hypothetical protein